MSTLQTITSTPFSLTTETHNRLSSTVQTPSLLLANSSIETETPSLLLANQSDETETPSLLLAKQSDETETPTRSAEYSTARDTKDTVNDIPSLTNADGAKLAADLSPMSTCLALFESLQNENTRSSGYERTSQKEDTPASQTEKKRVLDDKSSLYLNSPARKKQALSKNSQLSMDTG